MRTPWAQTVDAGYAVMTAAMYVVLALLDWSTPAALRGAGADAAALDPRLLKAVVLIGVELMVMTAVAMFFSTFSGSFLSAALALAFYVIGHIGEDLKHLDNLVHTRALAVVGRGLYYLLPNLAPLDVKADVVHGVAVSGGHMVMASLSSGLYISVLLLASMLIFSRRDLK